MSRPRLSAFVALTLLLASPAVEAQELSREERARLAEEYFAQEPRLPQVMDQAQRYYELHPEELSRVRRRLRSKAGMPYLVVSERYQNNSSTRDLHVMAYDGVTQFRIDDSYQAQRLQTVGILSWDIPVGVMTDAEFQTYQLALVQQQIIRTVNSWYYSRRMLLLELLTDPPTDPRAVTSLRLRVDGFTALLNVYTGGWYSRQLPQIPSALLSGSGRSQGAGE